MLDLVVLGNLIVDDVVNADGSTRMGQPGGAVIYVALAARLFGLEVGIVSLAGQDYPASMLEALAARGVRTEGIHAMDVPGLRLWLLDEGDKRQVVHRLQGPSHVAASPIPDHIPEAWRNARAVHLAPMPFEVQQTLVGALAGTCLLSLDPYELLRDDDLNRWRGLLRGVDVFLLGEDEMLLSRDPEEVLPTLVDERAAVVFKRGARGGIHWHRGCRTPWGALAHEKGSTLHAGVKTHEAPVDTTGAGDAFAAGYLAGRLRGLGSDLCLRYGEAAARRAIRAIGPGGLLNTDPEIFRSVIAGGP